MLGYIVNSLIVELIVYPKDKEGIEMGKGGSECERPK